MTDYKEEQEMELEALEAIYMEDFEKTSDSPLQFTVRLLPNPPDSDEENHVGLNMKCDIPSDYPDSKPKVVLEIIKGLNDKQVAHLNGIVDEQAEELAGTPMIFTIGEALKEWLVDNNQAGHDGSEYEKMLLRNNLADKAQAEEEERKEIEIQKKAEAEEDDTSRKLRIEGTPVNAETFATWKAAFDAEMAEKKAEEMKARGGGKTKVREVPRVKETGRELFAKDSSLVKSDEVDEGEIQVDEEEEAKAANVAGAIDETLFEFGDDEDSLDELSDLEDLESEDEEGS